MPEARIDLITDQITDVRIRLSYLENEVKRLADEVAKMRKAQEAPGPQWNTGYVIAFGATLVVILGLLVAISVRLM